MNYFQIFTRGIWSVIIFLIVTTPIFLTLMKTRGRVVLNILADNYIYVWGIYCQQGLSGNCKTNTRNEIYFRTKLLSFRVSKRVLDEIGFPVDLHIVVDRFIRLLRIVDQLSDSLYGYITFHHDGRVR